MPLEAAQDKAIITFVAITSESTMIMNLNVSHHILFDNITFVHFTDKTTNSRQEKKKD